MRGYAREVAFCTLYQWQLTGNYTYDEEYFDKTKLDDKDLEFVNKIVSFAVDNDSSIKDTIACLSHTYKIDRMYKTDITALQLAIAECRCCDTPAPVVVGEVVSIVKKYSTEKSVGFVNGILAEYIRRNA